MAKPFSIQAPEDIAKEYMGNKQRIAQAAQMGVVDPTAAVLAGMFIDRMRSAQVMEAGQTPTVAQQVLGGGGPPMPPAQQGLGSIPSPVPPSPSQMQAPTPGPEVMMAMGGLVGLPVPDAMFDEPTNGGFDDGYAGGGLVAFADGGGAFSDPSDYGAYIEQTAKGLFPDLTVAGRGRTAARNAQVGGVAGSYHLIDAARDLRVPAGMSKAEFISQLKRTFGPDYDVLPSKGNSVHVEPGPALGKKVRSGAADKPLPERNIQSPEGRRATLMDQFGVAKDLFSTLPDSRLGEAAEYYKGETSEETKKKNRKDDMWMAIAQLGANLAASDSPQFLQAVGQAIARTMPGVEATKKERKTAERSAMNALTDIYGLQRKEAKEVFDFGARLAEAEMGAESAETARAFARSERIDAEKTRAKEARIAQEAGKSPEERLIDAYYREFKKADRNLSDEDAYQRAVIAARTAIQSTKPAAGGATSNQKTLEEIRAGAGAQGGSNVVDFGSLQ